MKIRITAITAIILLAVIASIAGMTATPVLAADVTLISNMSQTTGEGTYPVVLDEVETQGFRTGSHSGGYDLSSIQLYNGGLSVGAGRDDITVTLL